MGDKGMSMTFSTIITAVLSITVLVILVLLIGQKFNFFNTEIQKCTNTGGKCVPKGNCLFTTGIKMDCSDSEVCCVNDCEAAGGSCVQECEGEGCNGDCPSSLSKIHFRKCEKDQVCCG